MDNVCNCRGTIGTVHQHCIDSWVFEQQQLSCPSCKAVYYVESVYHGNSPQLPEGYFPQLFYITREFIMPTLAQCAQIALACLFRYFVAPLLYGAYFYFPINLPTWEHKLAVGVNHWEDVVELTSGEANLQNFEAKGTTWALMWLYGIAVATAYRQIVYAYSNFTAYFGRSVGGTPKPPKPKGFSTVENVLSTLAHAKYATGCYMSVVDFTQQVVEEGIVVFAFTFTCRSYFLVCVMTALLVVAAIYLRVVVPRKELSDNTRRFTEPLETRDRATMRDINLWFLTYLYDLLVFSFILPIWSGIGIHYAVSPFCCAPPVLADLMNISFKAIAVYWAVGSFTLVVVVRTEALIVVPMFAPGVDLFFIRSVDLDNGEDLDGWDFVHSQVYDMDPLRVLIDFLKVGLCEVFFVSCFVRLPISGTWWFREFFFADTSTIALPLQFVPSSSITLWSGAVSLALFGTVLTCFALFPLQRFALKFLRPIVGTLAEIVALEDFLFDDDRIQILDTWLARGATNEPLAMPAPPLERMFVRREWWLPADRQPRFLRPRLFIFASLFFAFCSSTIWLPFIASAFVALSYTQCTVGVISIGLLAPFLVTDARLFFTCFLQVCVIAIVFVLSGVPYAINRIAALYTAFNVAELAQQTYDVVHLLRRRVVPKPHQSPPLSPTM